MPYSSSQSHIYTHIHTCRKSEQDKATCKLLFAFIRIQTYIYAYIHTYICAGRESKKRPCASNYHHLFVISVQLLTGHFCRYTCMYVCFDRIQIRTHNKGDLFCMYSLVRTPGIGEKVKEKEETIARSGILEPT
jgi:hypothetical protein